MPITITDRMKLLLAGFEILRRDYHKKRIMCATNNGGWRIYEQGFRSNAHLDRRMKELLFHDDVIEDPQ